MGKLKLIADIIRLKLIIIERNRDLWEYWDWNKTKRLEAEYHEKLHELLAGIF